MGKGSEIKGLRAALDNNKCLHLRSWRRPRQWSRAAAAVRPCWAPAPDCCRYLLSTDIYWYLLYRYLLSTAPLLQLIHGAASSPIHNKEMSSRISYGGNKTVKSMITQTMNHSSLIAYLHINIARQKRHIQLQSKVTVVVLCSKLQQFDCIGKLIKHF